MRAKARHKGRQRVEFGLLSDDVLKQLVPVPRGRFRLSACTRFLQQKKAPCLQPTHSESRGYVACCSTWVIACVVLFGVSGGAYSKFIPHRVDRTPPCRTTRQGRSTVQY